MATTTKPTKPRKTIWLVTDAETHGGGSYRGATPEEAMATFLKHERMRGNRPCRVCVASFAGQDHVSKHWYSVAV